MYILNLYIVYDIIKIITNTSKTIKGGQIYEKSSIYFSQFANGCIADSGYSYFGKC